MGDRTYDRSNEYHRMLCNIVARDDGLRPIDFLALRMVSFGDLGGRRRSLAQRAVPLRWGVRSEPVTKALRQVRASTHGAQRTFMRYWTKPMSEYNGIDYIPCIPFKRFTIDDLKEFWDVKPAAQSSLRRSGDDHVASRSSHRPLLVLRNVAQGRHCPPAAVSRYAVQRTFPARSNAARLGKQRVEPVAF